MKLSFTYALTFIPITKQSYLNAHNILSFSKIKHSLEIMTSLSLEKDEFGQKLMIVHFL